MEGMAAQADFCFVHFTDTHIMAGGTLRNLDTSASLQRVIEVLNALEPRPAFAVIGGDLVSPDMLDRSRTLTPAEYEPSYHLLRELLRPLQCPTYMLLGNHDHRQAFHQVMQTPVPTLDTTHHYSFDYQGYHFAQFIAVCRRSKVVPMGTRKPRRGSRLCRRCALPRRGDTPHLRQI
jgi:predicted MPP superfamily phosphohydrolase